MFSSRLPPEMQPNALSAAVAARRARRLPIVDLTESNPTRVGLPYPPSLLEPLGRPQGLLYAPEARGLACARAAVADDAARRGRSIDPGAVVLTASTSDAYSWLFKLLCDPGDAVLVPRPSYPLFEHLTALDSVRATPYALDYHGRWSIDIASLLAAPPSTRALLVVSPNNPTGSYLSPDDLAWCLRLCAAQGWALIVDEVFADYPLDAPAPLTDIAIEAGAGDVLAFTLGGASKTVGLPQVKLGWIVVGGPSALRDAALARLELIADTYLPVSTSVQLAARELLRGGASIRGAILERIRHNHTAAATAAAAFPACTLLRAEAGWTVVVRVPAIRSEDELVLALLEQEGILVHPGYFFDFEREAYVVVSLLAGEDEFRDAFTRLLRFASF